MDFQPIIDELDNLAIEYKINENTSELVSFKAGGIASFVVYPKTNEQFTYILKLLTDFRCKHFILGNGTNTIFNDFIYDGVIIVTKNIKNCLICKNEITVSCGYALSSCAKLAMQSGLSGLEFAYGIPGTVGGALYMNASAFGKSISSVLFKSTVYDKKSNLIFEIYKNEHLFSDKKSIFSLNKELVLLSSTFLLESKDKDFIKDLMLEYSKKRRESQPLDLPSAGSVFKRPINDYASRLIDLCGLKGFRIGGAEVSKKHAGFIVNVGNATYDDVKKLAIQIKKIVLEKCNVELEEEIIFVE